MKDGLTKIWRWLYDSFLKRERSAVKRPWYWRVLPSFTGKIVIFVGLIFALLFTIIVGFMMFNICVAKVSDEDNRSKILIQQISDSITANYMLVEGNIQWHAVPVAERWQDIEEEKTLLNDMLRGDFIHSSSLTVLPDKSRGVTAPMMYRVVRQKDGSTKFDVIRNRYDIPMRLDTMHLTQLTFNKPFITNGDTLMPVTTPYLNAQGNPVAYISYTVDVNRYLDCLNHLPDSTEGRVIFVVAKDGSYLMNPNKEKVLNINYEKDTDASNEFRYIVENKGEGDQFSIDFEEFETGLEDEEEEGTVLDPETEAKLNAMINIAKRSARYKNVRYLFTTYHEPSSGITVLIGKPMEQFSNRLKENLVDTLKLAFILLLIFLIIFRFLMVYMMKPIRRYSMASEHIATGDFDTPVKVRKTLDERQILGESLDYMRVSLRDYMNRVTEESAAREAMQKELSIANKIQMNMLARKFPDRTTCPHIDLYAYLRSAKEVGGDLYDFHLHDNILHFIVGDVSGKGVPASLVMAKTITIFRLVCDDGSSPATIARAINRSVAENNVSNMFVTLVVGSIDMNTGELRICNAGHDPIILMREGEKPRTLKVKPNLPVGLMDDFEYADETQQLVSGDRLMLYTDGVAEAENVQQELYTINAFLGSLETDEPLSAEATVRHAVSKLEDYTRGAEQNDDITMMCVCYE